MKWYEIKLNDDDTGYIYKNKPIFKKFKRAMSFHKEGLAAVVDETGAYHIDCTGKPLYEERYIETFGFYENIATVRDNEGYFHRDTKGNVIYKQKFVWSGNFQEGRCVVQTPQGFNHINTKGEIISNTFYKYCGDFKYGIAVVYSFDGFAFHIDKNGNRINNSKYLDAGVYHKGFAVVADKYGYYHVDKKGQALYKYRFKKAEVFYNGWALCEEFNGRKVRISEKGEKLYLPTYVKAINSKDLINFVKKGYKIGLLFRHAERYLTNEILTGNEVKLTENGKKSAYELGNKLKELESLNLISSPINRCISTLKYIKKGAEILNSIITSQILGDPGCYVNQEEAEICKQEMEKNGFMNYTMSYIQNLNITGSKNLSKASEEMEEFILKNLKPGLTLYNSHDFLVSAFMRYIGVKFPTEKDYVNYLEGVVLVVDNNEGIKTYRFLEGQDET